MTDGHFRGDANGLLLAVRVTPRAGRDAVAGLEQDSSGRTVLRVRLTAPPADGAANAALATFLAAELGLRARDVTILSGHSARLKILRLSGDGAIIASRLAALAGEPIPGTQARAARNGR